VQVNYDQQAETDYGTKLTAALAAGKGPNIFIGDNVQMSTWAGQKQLAPMEKYVKASKIITAKNFDKKVWAITKFGGHQYSLPLDALPMTMYYNKKLFRAAKLNANKPPTTSTKKFLATAKKLTKGSSQYGFFVPSAWPIFLMYYSTLAQFGGKPFNVKTKTATFNNTAGVNTLKALYNLIYKYKVSPANIGGTDPDMSGVATGKMAMVVDGPWQLNHPSIQALGADAGTAPFPQIGPKKAVAFYSHYLVSYVKNTAAENKAAVKFAEYFNKHSLTIGKAGDVPMYKPVLSSKQLKAVKQLAPVASMMKYAVPAAPTFQKYNDGPLFNDVVIPALQGKITPSQFKSKLNAAAQKVTQTAQS